jgi:hypothetical protein
MAETLETQLDKTIAHIVFKSGHVKKNCYKLNRKDAQNNNNHAGSNNENCDNKDLDS